MVSTFVVVDESSPRPLILHFESGSHMTEVDLELGLQELGELRGCCNVFLPSSCFKSSEPQSHGMDSSLSREGFVKIQLAGPHC